MPNPTFSPMDANATRLNGTSLALKKTNISSKSAPATPTATPSTSATSATPSTSALPPKHWPDANSRHFSTASAIPTYHPTELNIPKGAHKFTSLYKSSSVSSEEDVPLSMRFMHKPLRAREELKKASDPTRRNSLINAKSDGSELEVQTDLDPTTPIYAMRELNIGGTPSEPYRLVRKKSGEIVKPLLKDNIKHRTRSLPSTPTYKQVHFGGDTDVRYFKQKDRPAAILAQNSPTFRGQDDSDLPQYDSDDSIQDYFDDELNSHVDKKKPGSGTTKYPAPHHGKLIEWELELLNFPMLLYHEKITVRGLPVFLERTFISTDKKHLLGQIAVKNLAFEKYITVRYTCDLWATIVEIPTVYVADVPPVLRTHDYDRFIFKIPLDLLFNSFHMEEPENDASGRVQERVYSLCVRYSASGHEEWDNNDFKNYQIKLRKIIPVSAKKAEPKAPTMARSKQEAHSKKPKYSSLYLKRIVSEPSLATAKPEQPKAKPKLYHHDNGSSDYDFVKNDFYLSSPLLSSLNNKDELLYDDQGRLSPHILRESMLRAKQNNTWSPPPDDASVSPDAEEPITMSPASPKCPHRHLDSKSYKELLDSYCFFTTPGDENDERSTSTSPENDRNQPLNITLDPDSAYTVSSFLRH